MCRGGGGKGGEGGGCKSEPVKYIKGVAVLEAGDQLPEEVSGLRLRHAAVPLQQCSDGPLSRTPFVRLKLAPSTARDWCMSN